MSDVFYVKQGSNSPSITSTLLDGAGEPVDLSAGGTTVEFRMVGPAEVFGNAQIITATEGKVAYDWETDDLDEWGGYAVEWVVESGGNTDVFPGAGYNWVEVIPRVDTIVGGTTNLLSVRRRLGRSLTDPESARAYALIAELSALLERRLNRKFDTVTVTETHHSFGRDGRLQLHAGPVIEVTGITVNGNAYTGDLAKWETATFYPNSTVVVTFTAGSDSDAGVQGAVADVIARTLMVAPNVAVGAVSGYSVEGTSITFAGIDKDNNTGKFTVGDMGAFTRLRRPVFLT